MTGWTDGILEGLGAILPLALIGIGCILHSHAPDAWKAAKKWTRRVHRRNTGRRQRWRELRDDLRSVVYSHSISSEGGKHCGG